MNPICPKDKTSWRREMRRRLTALGPRARSEASDAICLRLRSLAEFASAQTLLAFRPLQDEPAIWPAILGLLEQGRRVAFPARDPANDRYVLRTAPRHGEPWIQGPFAILEPPMTSPTIDGNQLDFALVPGLGFAADGSRLGRGRGYMDRLLASITGFKCGVAFDEQLVETLPSEPHDVPLDCILTPSREWRRPRERP
jgi:5-formyltetrahydrofolate cyclo-ligase